MVGFRDPARYEFNGGYWTIPGRDWIDLEAGTTLRFVGRTEEQLLYSARELAGPVGTTILPGAMLRPVRFTRDGAVAELPLAFGSKNIRPLVRLACRDLRIEPTTKAEAASWSLGRDLAFDAREGVTMESGGELARFVDDEAEADAHGPFARALGDSSTQQVAIEVIHRGVRFRAHVDQSHVGGLIGKDVTDGPDEPSGCERVLRRGSTIYTQPAVAGQLPVIKQWPVVTLRRDAKALVSDWLAPWVVVRLLNPDPDILLLRGYVRARDLAPGSCGPR
ncbi:MAG: hypothetical protein IT370_09045 [Deltaproteobacteria bacterium]|nr:hypothetical protein [Deltaproteobacteria bacterium]